MENPDIAKIIKDFDASPPSEDATKWTPRGYIMTQVILYRCDADSGVRIQLVVPKQEKVNFVLEITPYLRRPGRPLYEEGR